MGTETETDVAIVGAGPTGLFAVFEAGMLKMRAAVIDTLPALGGQCAALYPEKPIFDIPGHPRIEAQALIDRLVEQAAPFSPDYLLGQQVMSLSQEGGQWRLLTSTGNSVRAKAVIVAAGAGAFGPNRPPLAGLEGYENAGPGVGVHYLVTRREDFRGRRVVIAGGGDSAVDWAISLSEVAERVSLVHRRPKFRAAPESTDRLDRLAREGLIDLVVPYQLAGLEGDGRSLSGVRVATLDGAEKVVEADALLPFFGLAMTLGPIADWGLDLERGHVRVDAATLATNVPGIYAVGDIAAYPGKLKLILSGFSEAAMACHAIHPLVHPDTALHFEYSTSKGVPAA